ncbi:unnamed protein product [Kluyveromyces dobzhanskii CBS 2104]|uniref:Superoxide dismutase 1 copper chaperone n=1 Tax=Kluyveromyces dobzhanskii CBS 2104 TaxID=1427455 RepID=A0A0A8LDX4_9SACH|nr:unnamed protein product [Kluyveromyces dobzhanskii CBS 2104]
MSTVDESNYEATYAVEMHCESCTKDIQKCLDTVDGIKNVTFNINDNLMNVEGHAAPSAIITALKNCGRDSIIRGTGKPNSAAVSILGQYSDGAHEDSVKGLVRVVEVAEKKTFFDINLNGIAKPGLYYASVRATGDLTEGLKSTGDPIYKFNEPINCSSPSDSVAGSFSGSAFVSAPLHVWELIGRSFVVTSNREHTVTNDSDISVGGILARSAGIWENDKEVCACSGKTLWQERKDAIQHNIRF